MLVKPYPNLTGRSVHGRTRLLEGEATRVIGRAHLPCHGQRRGDEALACSAVLRADFVVAAHPPRAHAVPARCPFKKLEPRVELQRLAVLIQPEVQHCSQLSTGVSGMMRCSVACHGADDAALEELAQKGQVVVADLLRSYFTWESKAAPLRGAAVAAEGDAHMAQ